MELYDVRDTGKRDVSERELAGFGAVSPDKAVSRAWSTGKARNGIDSLSSYKEARM